VPLATLIWEISFRLIGPKSGNGRGGSEPIHQLVQPSPNLFLRILSFTTLTGADIRFSPALASDNGFVLVLGGEVSVGADRLLGPGQVLRLDYPLAARGDTRVDPLRLEADLPGRVWWSVAN
jgi:hypothetical protein